MNRNIEAVLILGRAMPISNPYLIHFRWGRAMVTIRPESDRKPEFWVLPKKRREVNNGR